MTEAHPGADAGTGGVRWGLVAEGVGAGVVVASLVRVLQGLGPGPAGAGPGTLGLMAVGLLVVPALLLGGLVLRAGGDGARERRRALGLRPGWILAAQGLLVAVVGLAALSLLEAWAGASAGVDVGPPVADPADEGHPLVGLVRAHPWASIGLVAAGGAMEEFVYRGWGVLLVRRAHRWLAVPALVVSSLVFGAAHMLAPAGGFAHYALVGLVFGCAALASGSVVPGAIVHAAMNGGVMAVLAFGG